MSSGITIKILGDSGPFSRTGKSISYQICGGKSSFLVDCGAPIFQAISRHDLKMVDGLIVTHCHDDHKRWFTDLALFHMYALDVRQKLTLVTSRDIYDELMTASCPALDRTLSPDSKTIIDVPCQEYFDYRPLGPLAKFRIVSRHEGEGKTGLYIIDRHGYSVGPESAKIVISPKTGRYRMLFKDPDYKEWVEPESFYPFSSTTFYEEEKNAFRDEAGLTIEAVKAAVWHGVPAIGVRIMTDREKVFFSSDTVHNIYLWKQLCSDKRVQRLGMSSKDFESSRILFGDVNDYIERTWSEERYREALKSFEDAIVIQDVSACNSIVHTDYEKLDETVLRRERTVLTHSPDRIVSEWVLCDAGKTIRIEGDKFYEIVGETVHPMNADIYLKDAGKYYVGFKSDEGSYGVYNNKGLLTLSAYEENSGSSPIYKVNLYEDLSGKYFPKIDYDNSQYLLRGDGRVERIDFDEKGSCGRIVDDERGQLREQQTLVISSRTPELT